MYTPKQVRFIVSGVSGMVSVTNAGRRDRTTENTEDTETATSVQARLRKQRLENEKIRSSNEAVR
jgi:hypothetical protein